MALSRKKGLRKTPLKQKSSKKRVVHKSRTKTVYKPPAWFTKIKPGSHGNTPTQKRFWRVISCFVRQRDFIEQKGCCVSCDTTLQRWQDGDAAHFKRFSVCNSYFKFNPDNVALSCKNCNRNDDGVVGHAFGEELKRRYGRDHLDWIEEENLKYKGIKLETHKIVEEVERLLVENPWFDIKTTY